MMKEIRFTRHSMPYNSGETASFDDARADEYIAKGYAVEVAAEPEAVADGSTVVEDAPADSGKAKKPKSAKRETVAEEPTSSEQPGASN